MLNKLRTLRDLYSTVLSVESKSCGVDAFVRILNDVPNIVLCSYFGTLADVIDGELVKYFNNCSLSADQKRLLLELILARNFDSSVSVVFLPALKICQRFGT